MSGKVQVQTQPSSSDTFTVSGILQRKCACGTHTIAGGECESCRKEKASDYSQRAAISTEPPGEVPPVVHEVLRSSGQPLDMNTRAFFETRFAHDFSQVRVHTDAKAAESAQAVNALAYTVGNKMVFGREAYSPHISEGKGLIAHELIHVIQQQEGAGIIDRRLTVGKPDTMYERNAHVVAERIVSENHSSAFPILRTSTQIQRAGFGDVHLAEARDREIEQQGIKCGLKSPQKCNTYNEWLDTFPAVTSNTDRVINAELPSDLQNLIKGRLGQSGNLPDCADVSLLLRHYYLKARGQTFSFKVGKDVSTSETFTLGVLTSDKEVRACMIGTGTESFQETRSAFALVDFYKSKGKNILNLKNLLSAGLKPGDMFVWKRLPSIPGNFQGHAQTIQVVTPPKGDPNDAAKIIQAGTITVVQGNMEGGKGKGELQQRVYTFTELTGKPDGDADIKEEPRHREESFFGAGPWNG